VHTYLIGYRGSGKSTIGKQLAARLGCPIIDTDDAIEAEAGASIRQIFDAEGEAGFRDREERVIMQVAALPESCVVALGGGAILRAANQRAIRNSGRTIWLQGSPQFLHQRIVNDQSTAARRPNLSLQGGYDEVVEMLTIREPVYRQMAQMTVTTDLKTPDEIVAEIAAWVDSRAE
jgi:shikimate kinase